MTPGLDAGPCLAQQRTPIDPDEDAEQLETRLAEMGADRRVAVIDELESGTAKPIAQDKALASKAPRLKKEQGAIDWSLRARNQEPGPRPATLASRIHVLASLRRRAAAFEHRPRHRHAINR